MAFKGGLNLHIEVEGLGFGHYNTCVNLTLAPCFLWFGVPKINTYYMDNIQVLPYGNSWRFNPNMQYPHM